ncbi:MAG: porin [Candidatus Aminicenantes bacterium]|nr:MAG: porin [Candidatus Aminicenantes bacterium]
MMKTRLFISTVFLMILLPLITQAQSKAYQGEKLYELKCGRCHMAYAPQKFSADEWKTVMKEMGPLSGLTEETEGSIMTYLEENAGEKKIGGLPTAPVLGGYIYTEFFSSKASKDTFDIHYLNVNLTGRLHERVSYRAEFEFEHGGGEAEPPFIEQAYMDVWFKRNMALRIGAILAPFNRFDDFHAPLENMMVTRPQMSREISVSAWKEVGINLHGNFIITKDLYLNYDAYVINGLGSGSRLRGSRQYRDNNDAKSLGYRVSGVFQDRWELGTSFYHGAWDDDGKYDVNMLGFHFLGRLDEFSLYAEYAKALSENPEPQDKGNMDGYFIQGSYLFLGKFRTSVRYGNLDYLDLGNQLGRKSTDFDRMILALGFNYYLTKSIVFKFEYDFYFPGEREADINKNLLALQAAVRF